MAELYVPPSARLAATRAATLRQQFLAAVATINGNRVLGREEKRRQLNLLHQRHQLAMAKERRAYEQAFEDEQVSALRKLTVNPVARGSSLTMDIYSRRVAELLGQPTEALVDAYDIADLLGDHVGMQAVAVAALRRRMPGVPGDKAEQLVHRFAYAQEPDGHGGTRYAHPEASLGWDRLRELGAWTTQDRLAAAAVFSVSAQPPKPTDPPPRDPHDVTRDAVAALYSGNGAPAAPAQDGGGGEPAAL